MITEPRNIAESHNMNTHVHNILLVPCVRAHTHTHTQVNLRGLFGERVPQKEGKKRLQPGGGDVR